MKIFAILLVNVFCFGIFTVSAQNDSPKTSETLDNISKEISKISKSLEDLNKKLGNFAETFNSNQGLRLTERQQKLLLAFEFLNRAETRLSTLKLLKIQLVERENTARRRLSQVDENLRPENIDRTLNGTLDAEQVRNNRRQSLLNERNEINKLLYEIRNSIDDANSEIRQTESFLKNIRQRIFPEIEKELADL